MSGECLQCVTREGSSHPSYAPNVAVLLIRQSDYVLRYASLGHCHNLAAVICDPYQRGANYVIGSKLRKQIEKLEEFTRDSVPLGFPVPYILVPFHTIFHWA